jgi:hypothetical protein
MTFFKRSHKIENFYEPGFCNAIILSLRRTLVRWIGFAAIFFVQATGFDDAVFF